MTNMRYSIRGGGGSEIFDGIICTNFTCDGWRQQ